MSKIILGFCFFLLSIEKIIKDAVYKLFYKNLYLNYKNKKLKLKDKFEISSNFKIKKVSNYLNILFLIIINII